jgi:hypothetical protein
MPTEVYKKTSSGGVVERELSELGFDPGQLNFGTLVANAADDTESSTTATTWQQKLTVTTPTLYVGDKYVIQWYMEIRANLQNKSVQARVQVDDTTTEVLAEHEGNEWFPVTGFGVYTVPTEKTYQIDIDYAAVDGTAYIRRARVLSYIVEKA